MKYRLCLVLALCWAACSKHDSTPGNTGGTTTHQGDTTEYLVKVTSPEMADSLLFLYTDTVLRGYAEEYNYVGTPRIDGYFPVYTGGHVSALNKGADTLGSSATPLFNFLLDANNRIQLAVYLGSNAYYDSLAYNGAGQVAFIYEYSGSPSGVRYLSSISQLTWDANGDVTQFLTADDATDLQAGNYTNTAYLTYDGKVNPYLKTQAALLLALVQDGDYFAYLSAQNVATAQLTEYDSGSQAAESDANTYTYDTQGNPLSLVHAVTIKGTTVTTHLYFNYTVL